MTPKSKVRLFYNKICEFFVLKLSGSVVRFLMYQAMPGAMMGGNKVRALDHEVENHRRFPCSKERY